MFLEIVRCVMAAEVGKGGFPPGKSVVEPL